MIKENWHKITKATPAQNKIVNIEFTDNTIYSFDLKPFIKKGNVFEVLEDDSIFNKVKIGENGRSLEFPNELDFCADSLWLKAHPESEFMYSK